MSCACAVYFTVTGGTGGGVRLLGHIEFGGRIKQGCARHKQGVLLCGYLHARRHSRLPEVLDVGVCLGGCSDARLWVVSAGFSDHN